MRRCSWLLFAAACGSPAQTPALDAPAPSGFATLTATVTDTRFVTREHMMASGEMQISGEPFAEAMGRDLGGYSRIAIPADIYIDPSPLNAGPWIDLAGYSTGIESYEYSKQPMNMIALESGAGTSLAYGPLVNPTGDAGSAATAHLADFVQQAATASNAASRFVFAPGEFPRAPDRTADNPLGWPGLWPTTHVFESFDPAIAATQAIDLRCAISSDDSGGGVTSGDYECDATSLHLANRASASMTITPGADGFSGWKYGLWTINYLQVMHDSTEAGIVEVSDADLAAVGTADNTVVGIDDGGAAGAEGTFIGSSDIEGFQAAMFLAIMDNRAEDWLRNLATGDGQTLAGFSSVGSALCYSTSSAPRWFPARVAVTESDDGGVFPKPSYALADGGSELLDQAGLALGYAEMYALTDRANKVVGGAQTAHAYFDGAPFAEDDGLADGEATLHDRALAVMRVAAVNIARMHRDAGSGVIVDHAGGTTATTVTAAYTLLALRTVRRSLKGELELYSNNTPDTRSLHTPLDSCEAAPGQTFAALLDALIESEARLLLATLTDDTGRAFDGVDVSTGAVAGGDSLDAHAAAIRGLFAAYLATGDVAYRQRALAVYARLERTFYDPVARVYAQAPQPIDEVVYTPLRFALIQSALRDMVELVAIGPGQEALELTLEERVGRLNKLVLNGWDDRNGDRIVDYPDECVRVEDDLARGGLQMAERTLTGETGSLQENVGPGKPRTATSDREHDCVPEVDDAQLPAALAGEIHFHVVRP